MPISYIRLKKRNLGLILKWILLDKIRKGLLGSTKMTLKLSFRNLFLRKITLKMASIFNKKIMT
jgi:hypothetical protein